MRTKGFAIQRIAEDRRGRIVAIASGTDEFLAARYLPDGRPDRSFGKEGLATVPLTKLVDPGDPGEPEGGYSCCAEVSALRIEPDGGILIAGSYEISTVGSLELSILARLTPNGRLDRSFGEREGREATAGEVRLGALARTEVIALQGGNILLGGKRGVGVVVRLHGNGTFDRGFGNERGGGFITLPMPPPHHPARYSRKGAVTGLLPGPRGSVYVSGDANGDLVLARLRPDGSLDPGFADGGMIRVNGAARRRCLCSAGSGLARDSRGRFLLTGRLGSSPGGLRVPPQLVLVRLRPGGDPDRGFGRNGSPASAMRYQAMTVRWRSRRTARSFSPGPSVRTAAKLPIASRRSATCPTVVSIRAFMATESSRPAWDPLAARRSTRWSIARDGSWLPEGRHTVWEPRPGTSSKKRKRAD